ncbi:MAG: C_GCAxxG_C_C family protein [Elusimicrobia bacterium]|nr:C_GCAxxG_C_C family protein [Elusimicrobiota bacterium]
MHTSRRRLLATAGGLVVATAAAGVASACAPTAAAPTAESAAAAPTSAGPPTTAPTPAPAQTVAAAPSPAGVPWRYAKLDPTDVAERGYKSYSAGGCMYGACEAVVGALRDRVGAPYDSFPTAATKYGKAGVNGWGTLCGALNGACVAMYLATDTKTADALIDELFTWYGQQALPDYTPKTPRYQIVSSVAESPLCHASVTNWCVKSGFKALSPERAERCAWLTASVAKKTAELLNGVADGVATTPIKLSKDVSNCLTCHGKDGKVENVHMSRATTCAVCHDAADHK